MTTPTPLPAALRLQQLRADVAAILHEDIDDITVDENLIDLGLDSMRAMTLVSRWRDAGADISFAELAEHLTLSRWAELIEQKWNARRG